MANWAYTSYAIEGPKETLEKIYEAILHPAEPPAEKDLEMTESVETWSEGWEGAVLMALGINWKRRQPDGSGYYLRGFVQDVPWWHDDEHSALRFCAEEAWGATDLNEILEENLQGIKVFYVTEEEGEDVYYTNDKEGKYFPDRYWVDTCINDNYQSEYFVDEDSVYEWLKNLTQGKISTKEDIEAFNEDTEKNENDYIYIHQFEVA